MQKVLFRKSLDNYLGLQAVKAAIGAIGKTPEFVGVDTLRRDPGRDCRNKILICFLNYLGVF